MSEIKHVRCDHCDEDIAFDRNQVFSEADRGWACCMVGLDRYDFCPNCWKEIMVFVNTHWAKD